MQIQLDEGYQSLSLTLDIRLRLIEERAVTEQKQNDPSFEEIDERARIGSGRGDEHSSHSC